MTREDFLRGEIEKLRGKISLYQGMISEWERELGNSLSESAGAAETGAIRQGQKGGDPVALVREWQFFNKSQPEAARLLLEMVQHPLRTATILECIEKGGVKVGGTTEKSKKQNLYTILSRSGQFGRAAKDTWGLPNWPGVTPVETKSGKENDEPEESEGTKTEESKKATAGDSKPS
jgi:hypothetical protein